MSAGGGTQRLPSFAELQERRDGHPAGTAWGVFGDDDQVGTVNLLGAAAVLAGIREVVKGEVHSLNWRIDRPAKNAYRRAPKRVHLGADNPVGRDDYIDRFFLQYSSQWDGLRHIVGGDGLFYNNTAAAVVDAEGSGALGIQLWAERGIAGRGVLLDVARHLEQAGTPIDLTSSQHIGLDVLEATAAAQNVEFQAGDILLVRTGWAGWYETLDEDDQLSYAAGDVQPGLVPGRAAAEWLWDRHVAAVAADNAAFEAMPVDFSGDTLHRWLIPGVGMPIGEYFWLDGLADACAADRRWTFLFTSAPLNVFGGVGSPPNALALR
jgi:kynurenine formamidase